jgi:predicted acylesterase/phospholipase RssA
MAEIIDPADRGDTIQLLGEPQQLARRFGMAVQIDRLRIRHLARQVLGHVVHNSGGIHMNTPMDEKFTPKEVKVPEFVKHKGKQRLFKRAICLGGGGPAAGLHIGVLEGLAANHIKFTRESDIWALSCIGAWVGILYNQAKQNHEIEETYNFFRGVFRDNKSFQSFPMNTVFAPDYAADAEAMLDYLLEPRNYKNAFLPREIMKSFMHTMSALRGMAFSRRYKFSEGDFNRWILNDVLAVNPAVRLWTGMVYKSEITGLARLYYPDSKFLKDIKFGELEPPHHKPYIFHNAWNLRQQHIQLFSNRDPRLPSHNRYKRITPQSLCACSALPFVEETVEIDGEPYCEGALKDTVNFKDLLKDHHHPPHDPLDEIWISRIVDADQVRAPKDLHDALANLCQLFAATVGEDDVKLFLCKVRAHEHDANPAKAYKGTIVGIPTSSRITYEWSHRNLDAGRHYGRIAAQKAVNDYMAHGGPQPYGHLRILGDKLRDDERDEIRRRRREGYSHP